MILFVTVPNNSGSTLILRTLASSPNVSVLAKEIWFDAPNPSNTGGIELEGKDVRLADRSDYVVRYMPCGEPRIFSEQADLYVEENFDWQMIRKFWYKAWDTTKPVLLEKTPDNVFKAQFLAKEFSDAKFVISTREAEGFCASMTKYGFDVDRSYKHWKACNEKQAENARMLGGRCLVTTYEKICEDPDGFLNDLLEFVPELESLTHEEISNINGVVGNWQTTWFQTPRC